MRFSCIQENLNTGLNIISPAVSHGGGLPILNNILLQAQPEGVYLTATNLEVGIKCLVRGKTEENGEFTVPARLFSEYVGLLSGKVDIELVEQVLNISSGAASSKLKGLPASEFPLLPQIQEGAKCVFKLKDLLGAIEQVVFAASSQETRPEIGGVFIKIDPKEKVATFAATDSYRLAERKIPVEAEKEVILIIPHKTMQGLARILSINKAADGEVKMESSANQVSFSCDNIELVSRLVDGVYPDYEQIVPKEFKTEAVVEKDALVKAMKTASLFSRSGIYDVTMEAVIGSGLKIGSASGQLGEHSATVEADVKGDGGVIVFNYRYVLDGLQAIKSPKITVRTIDGNNPCLFSPTDEKGYLYVVMPIRQ